MPAYVVGRLTIHDRSWMAEYGQKSGALVARHGGRYLARGGAMERLEGDGAPPSGVVVVEFPTLAAAKAWYNDPEYAPLIKMRQGGAALELIAIEGLDGT